MYVYQDRVEEQSGDVTYAIRDWQNRVEGSTSQYGFVVYTIGGKMLSIDSSQMVLNTEQRRAHHIEWRQERDLIGGMTCVYGHERERQS